MEAKRTVSRSIPRLATRLLRLAMLGLPTCLLGFVHGPVIAGAFLSFSLMCAFIWQISPRLSMACLLAAVLTVVLLRTPVIGTWIMLSRVNSGAIAHPDESLRSLFTPGAGQDILPDEILQALSLIDSHGVRTYRLSDQLSTDTLLYQRLVESAWPIKMENSAEFTIRFVKEQPMPGCVEVGRRKDVALDHCH